MTSGYSGTPLARKLGIREGHRVLLVGPPTGLGKALDPLPPATELVGSGRTEARAEGAGAVVVDDPDGMPEERFDVVLLFCPDVASLHERFSEAVSRIRWAGGLWACWPKKSSGLYVDLAREEVREVGLVAGLVDNKVCAVDEDWSGLRFVVRTADRPDSVDEGGPGARVQSRVTDVEGR